MLSSDNQPVNQTPHTSTATPPHSQAKQAAELAGHYENFPVASWLCPPHLRPPIAAIYGFARTADDIADEGDASSAQRMAELAEFAADLAACYGPGVSTSTRWPHVFTPLRVAIAQHHLPQSLLADLLSAFSQDVQKTAAAQGYENDAELLDYCARSANPVGRLLLHLYSVTDATALQRSDNICTALQLINFWQDISVDIPRGRYYLPLADCAAHGIAHNDLAALNQHPNTPDLIAARAVSARATMLKGSKLVHQVPGRAGWELRLVAQGGLRILDKIEAIRWRSDRQRVRITAWDVPLMLWRALWM